MILKDNKLFELPQREDNREIELFCQAKGGPEEKNGVVCFSVDERSKKDILYKWLRQQIGKDIETIYHTAFSFGADDI